MEFRCRERLESHVRKSKSFDQDESRNDLVKMIILHEYHMSIVNHIAFRTFISGLRPEFKIVSRNTIRKDILAIYDVERKINLELLVKWIGLLL